jgi:hypothetical protein
MLRTASMCVSYDTTTALAAIPTVTPSTSISDDTSNTADNTNAVTSTTVSTVAVAVAPKRQRRNYHFHHTFLHQCMQYIARTNSSGSSSSISEIEEAMILRALELARYVLCHTFAMWDIGTVISTFSGNPPLILFIRYY